MAVPKEITVSADNENLGKKVAVTLEIDVPENVAEAAGEDFYGEESKLLDSIQADWGRRVSNAIRPTLRDSTEDQDFVATAISIANAYKPGRRGGFGKVEMSEDELDQIASTGSVEDLKALLRQKGVSITG